MAELFGQRHGVAGTRELVSVGVTRAQVRAALDRGELERLAPGVLRALASPHSFLQEVRAAQLSVVDGVVGGGAGAKVWGWRRVPRRPVTLLARSHSTHRKALGVVRRFTALTPGDVIHRPDGIDVASPMVTLFTVADEVNDDALGSMLEQALHEGQVTFTGLAGALERFGRRGTDGSARFRRVLEARRAWLAPAESDGEYRLISALVGQVTDLVTQHEMVLSSGRWVRLDAAVLALKYDVEVDHPVHHQPDLARRRDRRRDEEMRADGWAVRRFTTDEVTNSLAAAVSTVLRDLDLRSGATSGGSATRSHTISPRGW